ncbi:hypothetical protein SLA2020_430270 [Shorea laevis]
MKYEQTLNRKPGYFELWRGRRHQKLAERAQLRREPPRDASTTNNGEGLAPQEDTLGNKGDDRPVSQQGQGAILCDVLACQHKARGRAKNRSEAENSLFSGRGAQRRDCEKAERAKVY